MSLVRPNAKTGLDTRVYDKEYSALATERELICCYLKPNYNVAPSQDVPVIINNGANHLAMFRWGLCKYFA